jgi:hypothetical protein
MSRPLRGAALLAGVLLAGLVFAGPAAAGPAFHGVVVQEQPTEADADLMRESGVGAVRFPLYWADAEPRPGVYDWTSLDATVARIAAAGARPLPTVIAPPSWLEDEQIDPPIGTARERQAWASFLRAAVARYGPGGPGVPAGAKPIRDWQLWNEPNLPAYWRSFPSPAGYARLLHVGASAVRSVDPEARIVLAGLSPAGRGIKPWTFLRRLYANGAAGDFDLVALHPYGRSLSDVSDQVDRARRIMRRGGDRTKPMLITEIGWGSAGPLGFPLTGTPKSQARMVRAAFDLFERTRRWRIRQVFWFSWRDTREEPPACGFCTFTGLLHAGGRPKPSLRSFRLSAAASGSTARGYGAG